MSQIMRMPLCLVASSAFLIWHLDNHPSDHSHVIQMTNERAAESHQKMLEAEVQRRLEEVEEKTQCF